MAIITIDTKQWITPKRYAELLNISASAVTKRMKHKDYQDKIWIVPELGLKLIEHPKYKPSKK